VRVLFVYSTLTVGGAERQLALLAPALAERGYDVTVATLRHKGRYFDELAAGGTPMVYAAMRSRFDARGGARAYRLWRSRPDVVFSSSVDAQVIGQLIAARSGARHLTAEHGGAGIPRSFHRRLLTRLVAPRVAGAIAVSASQIPELSELGYPPERITVIPNGIPYPMPNREPAAVREELGLSAEDVVAVFVATLRPEKRAGSFVEAAIAAHERQPRLRAVVVGGGPDLERVRALAATAPDVVRVLGERRDIADLIGAGDLVCLASSFEGLPMVVLESFALARPVLATAVGGLPEVVIPGRTGWLVPFGDAEAYADALVHIASGSGQLLELGSEAKRLYEERFTLERMVERYAEVLGPLPGGTTPERPAQTAGLV
jgi:starch synthase (maltosyl-transferring)